MLSRRSSSGLVTSCGLIGHAHSLMKISISQVARARATHGRGHDPLWTGDPGTALYIADCLAGGGALPLP